MRFRFASIAVILFASVAAHADTVTFTLLNPTQSTTGGNTLSFNASVFAPTTNTGSEDLDGLQFNISPGNMFTADANPFLNNYPLSLAPGESYSGLLFTLLVPSGSLPTSYSGSVELDGGPLNSKLSTQAFTVNVTPAVAVTPEPSSLLMLGTGMVAMAASLRRRLMVSGRS